jgi:hypothetical protein
VASAPDPLFVPWQGRLVRVRHDDPQLRPYSPRAMVIMAAMQLVASDVGLVRILEAVVGDRYAVAVRGGPVVALRRR